METCSAASCTRAVDLGVRGPPETGDTHTGVRGVAGEAARRIEPTCDVSAVGAWACGPTVLVCESLS